MRLSDERLKKILEGCKLIAQGPYAIFRTPDDDSSDMYVICSQPNTAMRGFTKPIAWAESVQADHFRRLDPQTVAALVSELMEAREAMRWQTMDTAPKDGTVFLAFEDGSENRHYECWWQDDFPNWVGWQDWWDSEPNPTHWMPLPDARNFLKDKETDNAE